MKLGSFDAFLHKTKESSRKEFVLPHEPRY